MFLQPQFDDDKFSYPASRSHIMKIQGEVQKHMKNLDIDKITEGAEDFQKANYILHIYGMIAYDEGFRHGLSSLKKENDKVKIKNRKKNDIVYKIDKNETQELQELIQRRIDSELMKAARIKFCEEKGMEYINEDFVLSVVIHSYFEAGYAKSSFDLSTIYNTMFPEKPERANLISELFKELLPTEK